MKPNWYDYPDKQEILDEGKRVSKVKCNMCGKWFKKENCRPTDDGKWICDFCVERFDEPDCRDEGEEEDIDSDEMFGGWCDFDED